MLNLAAADVTSDGLARWRGSSIWSYCGWERSRVDDAGLADLAKLPAAKFLIIENTPITDAGIQQLSAVAGLKSLYVEGTKVTDAGVARLQESLPNLHVHW